MFVSHPLLQLGLYALAANDIMSRAAELDILVGVSFFEVYRGHVLDLLDGHARLEVLEDGKGKVQVLALCLRRRVNSLFVRAIWCATDRTCCVTEVS